MDKSIVDLLNIAQNIGIIIRVRLATNSINQIRYQIFIQYCTTAMQVNPRRHSQTIHHKHQDLKKGELYSLDRIRQIKNQLQEIHGASLFLARNQAQAIITCCNVLKNKGQRYINIADTPIKTRLKGKKNKMIYQYKDGNAYSTSFIEQAHCLSWTHNGKKKYNCPQQGPHSNAQQCKFHVVFFSVFRFNSTKDNPYENYELAAISPYHSEGCVTLRQQKFFRKRNLIDQYWGSIHKILKRKNLNNLQQLSHEQTQLQFIKQIQLQQDFFDDDDNRVNQCYHATINYSFGKIEQEKQKREAINLEIDEDNGSGVEKKQNEAKLAQLNTDNRIDEYNAGMRQQQNQVQQMRRPQQNEESINKSSEYKQNNEHIVQEYIQRQNDILLEQQESNVFRETDNKQIGYSSEYDLLLAKLYSKEQGNDGDHEQQDGIENIELNRQPSLIRGYSHESSYFRNGSSSMYNISGSAPVFQQSRGPFGSCTSLNGDDSDYKRAANTQAPTHNYYRIEQQISQQHIKGHEEHEEHEEDGERDNQMIDQSQECNSRQCSLANIESYHIQQSCKNHKQDPTQSVPIQKWAFSEQQFSKHPKNITKTTIYRSEPNLQQVDGGNINTIDQGKQSICFNKNNKQKKITKQKQKKYKYVFKRKISRDNYRRNGEYSKMANRKAFKTKSHRK